MTWLDRIRLRWRIARLMARIYLIERAIAKATSQGCNPDGSSVTTRKPGNP